MVARFVVEAATGILRRLIDIVRRRHVRAARYEHRHQHVADVGLPDTTLDVNRSVLVHSEAGTRGGAVDER